MKRIEGLSPRELQVLRLAADGYGDRAISERLDLSPYTVRNHMRSIRSKLGARDRTQAALEAYRLGLIK